MRNRNHFNSFSARWCKAWDKAVLIFFILFNGAMAFSQDLEIKQKEPEGEHKLISANIRVALKEDEEKGLGWNSRKELVFKVLKESGADIICLQEVLAVQNKDLKTAFPDFTSIGFEGPEMDAYNDGEYHWIAKNPIMFSRKKYELIAAGTYWLSETPHLGGTKSWNTARARNVNWVRLKDRATSKEFRIINTHLDHISDEAREKQVSMIIEEANQYPEDFPQVLAGDFNADKIAPPIALIKTRWKDSYAVIHGDEDPGYTAHAFKGRTYGDKANKKRKGKIDFIFYRGNMKAGSSKIIKDSFDGIYPSDHYFITADLSI